jgi:hypothetical protein
MITFFSCLLALSPLLPAEPFSKRALVTLAIIETNCGRNNTVSPKGARGLMQIMPETGRWLWYKCNQKGSFLEVFLDNDRVSLELADCYVRLLFEQYNSWALVAAAYNGGPRVANQLQEQRRINLETANFVALFYTIFGRVE